MLDFQFYYHVSIFLFIGFAYIEYSTPEEAQNAMKHMDGGQIDGQVKIQLI